MSTPEPTAASSTSNATDVEREIRFAVVMYGGVSLAIYINGVAQELLNMVRATAPRFSNGSEALVGADESGLPGAMSVYRKLGQYLSIRDQKERDKKLLQSEPTTDSIRFRFVVDVISGTSAGGINGVFLAKALARNQGMEGLKKLWLSEGDFGKLLNDKGSVKDLRLKLQKPQQSLLNSQRMYRKLLEALDNMDVPANQGLESDVSPLVRELDLFVTTTDIEGIPLPIALSDEVVYERRYKNVFHFRYATTEVTGSLRDDFIKENDPFLAFAARCTSSFPFAFEAMQLSDITNIANAYAPYMDKSATGTWDEFFSDYLRNGLFDLDREARGQKATGALPSQQTVEQAKQQLRASFCKRSFGDGGYLDNKPFSYATSILSRRYADSAVARKLLYVEPTPEHPELTAESRDRPDFAENVYAAVLDLPRQETIREDLDRLYERNEQLERVAMLAKEVDDDIEAAKRKPKANFKISGLKEMIDDYGVNYGAYHRLKVAESTNVLANLIARAAGHDSTSDATDAIRELVKAWRRSNYAPQRADADAQNKKTENQFLDDFDIRYSLRRLTFLNRRINQLADFDEDAIPLLKVVAEHEKTWPTGGVQDLIDNRGAEFRAELNRLKKEEIAPALREARSAEENLRNHNLDPGKALYGMISQLKIGWPDLKSILECEPGVKRNSKADDILKTQNRRPILSQLAKIISDAFQLHERIEISNVKSTPGADAARLCVQHYNRKFIYYDLVTYPIQYGTGAGESNVVDVFRVSPEDASSLMAETPGDRNKLAGRAVMSFGAFLDERWRRNDMLWGRLDAAERLITVLLPACSSDEVRQKLVYEAHLGILTEEIKGGNGEAVCRLLSNASFHRRSFSRVDELIEALLDDTRDKRTAIALKPHLSTLVTPHSLDSQIDTSHAVDYIQRSTNIMGNMLGAFVERRELIRGNFVTTALARVGTIFGNIISVALPQSFSNQIFRSLIGLIYLFDIFLIVAGKYVGGGMSASGWKALGLTALIHFVVEYVGAFVSRRHWFIRFVALLVASPIVALLILGVARFIERWSNLRFSRRMELTFFGLSMVGIFLYSVIAAVNRRVRANQSRPSN